MNSKNIRTLTLLAPALVAVLLFIAPSVAQTPTPSPTLPSERPARFQPTNDGFEYVRRDEWISMRDGVKLHTVILIPKGRRARPSF